MCVPSTETIDVSGKIDKNHGVEMYHNLPSCFVITSEGNFIRYPCKITINYDPFRGSGQFSHHDLYIKFTDNMKPKTAYNPVIVIVEFRNPSDETLMNRHKVLTPGPSTSYVNTPKSILKAEVSSVPKIPPPKSPTFSFEGLECRLCCIPFSDTVPKLTPKILTKCGHTVCQECAGTLQGLCPNRAKPSIECPFDRIVTEGIVASLPKNFSICELIREKKDSELNLKKVTAATICENPILPCYENENHESTVYCQSCMVDLCNSCFQSVHSSKILSGHNAIPVSEKPFQIPQCPVHSAYSSKYMCQEDKCKSTLCCNLCRMNSHKEHKLILITEAVDQNERTLIEIVNTLSSAEIRFACTIDKADECIQTIDKNDSMYTGMVASIKKYYDIKKSNALQRLEGLMDSKKESMEKDKENLEHDLQLIKETRLEVERTLKRRDLLFAEEIIGKGEAMCSLTVEEKANFAPLTLPTLEEIIDRIPSTVKPVIPSHQPSQHSPPMSSSADVSSVPQMAPIVSRVPPPPPPPRYSGNGSSSSSFSSC